MGSVGDMMLPNMRQTVREKPSFSSRVKPALMGVHSMIPERQAAFNHKKTIAILRFLSYKYSERP